MEPMRPKPVALPKRFDSLLEMKEETLLKGMSKRVGWLTTGDIVADTGYPPWPVSDVLWKLEKAGIVKHSRSTKKKDLWMLTEVSRERMQA